MTARLKAAAYATRPFPKLEHGNCDQCGEDTPLKHYCWGCHRYICQGCEKFSPEGTHKPEDHVHASPLRGLP